MLPAAPRYIGRTCYTSAPRRVMYVTVPRAASRRRSAEKLGLPLVESLRVDLVPRRAHRRRPVPRRIGSSTLAHLREQRGRSRLVLEDQHRQPLPGLAVRQPESSHPGLRFGDRNDLVTDVCDAVFEIGRRILESRHLCVHLLPPLLGDRRKTILADDPHHGKSHRGFDETAGSFSPGRPDSRDPACESVPWFRQKAVKARCVLLKPYVGDGDERSWAAPDGSRRGGPYRLVRLRHLEAGHVVLRNRGTICRRRRRLAVAGVHLTGDSTRGIRRRRLVKRRARRRRRLPIQ